MPNISQVLFSMMAQLLYAVFNELVSVYYLLHENTNPEVKKTTSIEDRSIFPVEGTVLIKRKQIY